MSDEERCSEKQEKTRHEEELREVVFDVQVFHEEHRRESQYLAEKEEIMQGPLHQYINSFLASSS